MFEPPICGPTTKARTSVDAAETCKTSVKKENICRVPCTYLAYHCLAIGLCWSMLQALMGDAFLLGKALQALVTPELLPGFLVTASEFCPQQNIRAYDCHTCAFTACLRPLLMFGSYAVLYHMQSCINDWGGSQGRGAFSAAVSALKAQSSCQSWLQSSSTVWDGASQPSQQIQKTLQPS